MFVNGDDYLRDDDIALIPPFVASIMNFKYSGMRLVCLAFLYSV